MWRKVRRRGKKAIRRFGKRRNIKYTVLSGFVIMIVFSALAANATLPSGVGAKQFAPNIPGAPTISSIASGATSLSVTFTGGSANGGTITMYRYSTDNGTTWQNRQDSGGGASNTPLVITTLSSDGTTALSSGVTYQVRLRAVNEAGEGVVSNAVSAALTPADVSYASTLLLPASPVNNFLQSTNGTIFAITQPQTDGSFYVGGKFSLLNGIPVTGIARIDTFGNVDPSFDPVVTKNNSPMLAVYSIVVESDGDVVFGGDFNQVDGTTRNGIARVNSSGTLDSNFNPNVNSYGVNALLLESDGDVVLGGSFTQVSSTTRNNLARVNSSGTLDSNFNPNVNGNVNALLLESDGDVVLGGSFTQVSSTTRNRLARVNSSGTLDSNFNPNVNESVNTLLLESDGDVVLGGSFTQVSSTTRNRLARVNSSGTLDSNFNPNVDSPIRDIALESDGDIVLGGPFTQVSSTTRNGIARVNSSGTLDSNFNPNVAGGQIFSVSLESDGDIVFGGDTKTVGGTLRQSLARVNSSGTLDSNFNLNGLNADYGSLNGIYAVAVDGDGKVVIGGQFTSINGATRNNLARINTDGTLDTNFNPNVNNSVYAITIESDGDVVFGGDFTQVGSTTRNRLARVNSSGTLDSNFNPNVNSAVNALLLESDGDVVLGGDFTQVSSTTRNGLARVNSSGTLDSNFNPNVNSAVSALLLESDGDVVLGGYFTQVSSTARNRLARVNSSGTLDSNFNPNVNSNVNDLLLESDGDVVLGGSFTQVSSTTRNNLARVNSSGTLDSNFNPNVDSVVSALALESDGDIVLGGNFGQVSSTARNGLARVNSSGTLDSNFNPNLLPSGGYNDGFGVSELKVSSSGNILVGGNTPLGLSSAPYFWRYANLTSTGALAFPGFQANDSSVSVYIQSKGTYTGGPITNYEYATSTNGTTWGSWTAFNPTVSPGANYATGTITGLNNGTTYYVKVRGILTSGGRTAETNVMSGSTTGAATAPGAPGTPTGTYGNAQVALSWSAPGSNGGSAITDYVIQYAAYSGGSWGSWTTFNDGTSTSTSATVTGLTNGTDYKFRVAATNAIGTSSYSSESSTVTPRTTPSAPTITSVTTGVKQLTVNFTAGSNGGVSISNYEYQIDGGSWVALSPTDTTSPVTVPNTTSLSDGTSYAIRIRAVNSEGSGAQSNQVSQTTVSVPGTPGTPTGTAGDTEVSLSWSAPGSNGGSAITDYVVQYSSNGGTTWTTFNDGTSTSTSATVTGLTNSTEYVFHVAAVNVVGTGSYSTSSTGVTPTAAPATVPSAPQNFTATPGNAQIALDWDAPSSDGGAAITGYIIAWSDDDFATYSYDTVSNTVTDYVITGLTNDTSYDVAVAAENSVGLSDPASLADKIPYASAPSTPAAPTATEGDTECIVSWVAPNNNGSAITGYTLQEKLGTGSWSTVYTGTNLTYTSTGLTNDSSYTYRVLATNSVGSSSYSSASSACVPHEISPPGAPTDVFGVIGLDGTEMKVYWTAPESNGGSAITDYVVQYAAYDPGNSEWGSWTTFSDGTSTNTYATVTGLTAFTEYKFRVAATNSSGTGDYSSDSSSRLLIPLEYTITSGDTGGSKVEFQGYDMELTASWDSGFSYDLAVYVSAYATGDVNFGGINIAGGSGETVIARYDSTGGWNWAVDTNSTLPTVGFTLLDGYPTAFFSDPATDTLTAEFYDAADGSSEGDNVLLEIDAGGDLVVKDVNFTIDPSTNTVTNVWAAGYFDGQLVGFDDGGDPVNIFSEADAGDWTWFTGAFAPAEFTPTGSASPVEVTSGSTTAIMKGVVPDTLLAGEDYGWMAGEEGNVASLLVVDSGTFTEIEIAQTTSGTVTLDAFYIGTLNGDAVISLGGSYTTDVDLLDGSSYSNFDSPGGTDGWGWSLGDFNNDDNVVPAYGTLNMTDSIIKGFFSNDSYLAILGEYGGVGLSGSFYSYGPSGAAGLGTSLYAQKVDVAVGDTDMAFSQVIAGEFADDLSWYGSLNGGTPFSSGPLAEENITGTTNIFFIWLVLSVPL